MTGFSIGDWIFIAGVMVVIVVCIAISGLRIKK
jgi:tRNA G37 N-methylase TrmD